MTSALSRIRWLRVVMGGFLVEVLLIAIAIPVTLAFGQTPLLYVVPPACLVMTFIFGWWAARKVESGFVLHGTLVGIVAALLYIGLTWGKTLPMAYLISHGLKVVGGAAGGFLAGRQVRTAARTASH
jgi:hypothetical protein